MSKFYVYIHLEQHKYKVNKEDVRTVHSHPKAIHPPLPPYHRIRKGSRSPLTEPPMSDPEEMAQEVTSKGSF